MKKATSQDVAELAGVSQATVSLILNNSDKITFSNETKERVLAAAQKLNYRLPQRKKQREKKASNMLLVLTPTLTNQYYAELIQAIEDYADTLDYRVIAATPSASRIWKSSISTLLSARMWTVSSIPFCPASRAWWNSSHFPHPQSSSGKSWTICLSAPSS